MNDEREHFGPVVPHIDIPPRPRVAWLLPVAVVGVFAVVAGLFVTLALVITALKPTVVVDVKALALEVAPLLDSPVSKIDQWEIACSASTATNLLENASDIVESIYVANDSTTCVRIGGDDVTSSTGASIGDGCRDGAGMAIDTRHAWCLSTSGSVTVDVLGGRR